MQIIIHTYKGDMHQIEFDNTLLEEAPVEVCTMVVRNICKQIGISFNDVHKLTDTEDSFPPINYN